MQSMIATESDYEAHPTFWTPFIIVTTGSLVAAIGTAITIGIGQFGLLRFAATTGRPGKDHSEKKT
jgi:hypothetical protein